MEACVATFDQQPSPPLHHDRRQGGTQQRSLAIGVIGPGRVGSAVLEQLREAHPRLVRGGLNLLVRGVAGRRRMWLDCDDPQLNGRTDGAQTWRPANLDDFVVHIRGEDGLPTLMLDCTASEDVANHYLEWLAAGIHVATPSKLAGSGPLQRWNAIQSLPASGGRFRHEAAVCAGLPVVQTLRDLVDTGDEIIGIEGMFSGTLAWLCNRYDGCQPFPALLREAHVNGYTEPDPRADLSGLDVARKLVILAREAGFGLSLNDVAVESLVPPTLMGLSTDTFTDRLDELDAPLAASLARARAQDAVLRHVASLDRNGRAQVRLTTVAREHPFAHTRLTDNVVQFHSRRYHDNPLVIQGPGAGPEVTAAGVFGDVLRIAESLVPLP